MAGKLRSYAVAHRELVPDTIHDTTHYANNRAESSDQPTRVRERVIRRFQVNATSSAVPEGARYRIQFIQSWPSPCFSQELSVFPVASFCLLESRCSVIGF